MQVVTLKEKEMFLEERKRTLGVTAARIKSARNNGSKRTSAKRALLKVVKDEAQIQGRLPPFVANF